MISLILLRFSFSSSSSQSFYLSATGMSSSGGGLNLGEGLLFPGKICCCKDNNGLFGAVCNESPDSEAHYVEKDPRGRYVRVFRFMLICLHIYNIIHPFIIMPNYLLINYVVFLQFRLNLSVIYIYYPFIHSWFLFRVPFTVL